MSSELMEIIDEGRAEGIAEERQRSIKMIVNLYNKGLIDENVAAEELGISVDEFMKKVREV